MTVLPNRPDVVRCYVDTEFYEDGETIDLISIGAVRSDGAKFYACNQDAKLHLAWQNKWLAKNVLSKLPPFSDTRWMPRAEIAKKFARFLGLEYGQMVKEIWGYFADYDWVVICQMYGTMMQLPEHFPRYCLDLKQLSYMLGNPKHPEQTTGEHDALCDAEWNMKLHHFLIGIQERKSDERRIASDADERQP